MDTKKIGKVAGWVILVFALVVLGVPALIHVLHLGLLVVKLVAELAVAAAVAGLGIWLIRR